MESPEPIIRLLFILPLVLLGLITILVKFPWRMILLVWLAGTLIQELTFAVYPRGKLLSQRLLMALYLYPFALFPLGLWSAILGVACWALAARMRWVLQMSKPRQLLLGLLSGLLIGTVFSFAIGKLGTLGSTAGQNGLWFFWLLGGAFAGAVDGTVVAMFLPREDSPRRKVWRWAYR